MAIKSILQSFKLTRGLYKQLANMKKEIIFEKKRKTIQKSGLKTIETIQRFLQKEKFDFFFDMGTLLGIIREGRLLGHDLDIDVGCFVNSNEEKERLSSTLIKNKCQLKYRYEIEGIGVVEESYILNNIKFDVNFYFTENDKSVCYLMYKDPGMEYDKDCLSVVKLTCSRIEMIRSYKWRDVDINVPENPEQYLANRYGENWRIPDKNYIYWKGPSTIPTNLKGYRTVDR